MPRKSFIMLWNICFVRKASKVCMCLGKCAQLWTKIFGKINNAIHLKFWWGWSENFLKKRIIFLYNNNNNKCNKILEKKFYIFAISWYNDNIRIFIITRQIKVHILVIGFSYDWTCVSDFRIECSEGLILIFSHRKNDDKYVYFYLAGNNTPESWLLFKESAMFADLKVIRNTKCFGIKICT